MWAQRLLTAVTPGRHRVGFWILAVVAIGIAAAWWFLKSFGESCHADHGGWWTKQICKDSARSLWTAVSGIAAAPALLLTWYWRTTHKKQELRTAHESQVTALGSQVTGRFVAAVEMLRKEGLTQEGGMLALERIAIDSPRDLETVTNILFGVVDDGKEDKVGKPRRSALTAISILRRIGEVNVRRRGNALAKARLQYADLARRFLNGANLAGANLYGARLDHSLLLKADLTRADLTRADLSGAFLSMASLERANLNGADLSGADLSGARLYGADLTRADLSGARLYGADLDGANLDGANLDGSSLRGTLLNGAKLKGARHLTQAQIDSAKGDARTELPPDIARPEHWK